MSCICVKGAETLEGRFVLDRMESKSVATTVVVFTRVKFTLLPHDTQHWNQGSVSASRYSRAVKQSEALFASTSVCVSVKAGSQAASDWSGPVSWFSLCWFVYAPVQASSVSQTLWCYRCMICKKTRQHSILFHGV